MNFLRQLPIPKEIKEQFPISEKCAAIKAERDQMIADVFTGDSDRFLLIIGPCSADNETSVMDYIGRLVGLQEKVKDKILIIPRIYTNKPRTTGEGYKGMATQPDPTKKPDLLEGLISIRRLHLRAIEETGFVCADEMLYPVPVGMKNPTSGDLSVMLNSIRAAQLSHTFLYRGWEVETEGNPLTHAILRGSVNKHGRAMQNYHYEDLILLHDMYMQRNLLNPAVIVDVNHSNSNKQYLEQIRISKEVLHSCRHNADIGRMVKGLMIESYIEDGCQSVDGGVYGKSITDPCLGWEKSERLVLELADML